jgi:hypothetical protein
VIISYKHRFTFIHCPKAAGTSVAVYLAKHLGPRDLQLGSWLECFEHGVRPNLRFYWDVLGPSSLPRTAARFLRRPPCVITMMNQVQKKKYRTSICHEPAHPTADQIRDFDPVAWERHFKFCFVRNPYERAVSHYLWMERVNQEYGKPSRTFLEYLLALQATGKIDEINAIPSTMYTLHGKVCVDFIGRFENLAEDMKTISTRIGLPPQQLAHAKQAPTKTSYRDWYTTREKALVEAIFGDEIERFGYAF